MTQPSTARPARFLSGSVDQVIGEAQLVLWVLWALRGNEGLVGYTPSIAIVLHFLLFFTVLVVRPRGSVGAVRISIPIVMWLGLWVMSSLWSWNFRVWLAEFRVAATMIMVAMMLAGVLDLVRLKRGLLNGAYLTMAISVVYGATSGQDPSGAWIGAFEHKNLLGGITAVFALWIFALEKRPHVKAVGLVTALALVVLSQSATALLMMGAAFATAVVLKRVATLPTREAAAYFFSVIAFVLCVLSFIAFQSATVVTELGRDSSFSGRTELWPAVVEEIGDQPWTGYGPGLWIRQNADPARYISTQTGFSVGHSHNTALEVLLEWGVIGLVMYVWILIAVGRVGWGVVRFDPDMGTMLLGFIAVLLVQSFSEPALGGWVAMLGLLHVVGLRVLHDHRSEVVHQQVLQMTAPTRGLPPLPD